MLLINKSMSEFALNLYWQPLKDGNSHQRPMGHFLVVSTQTVWAFWSCSMIRSQCGYINFELWLYIGNDLVIHCVLVLSARFSKTVWCILVFNGCFHSTTEEDTISTLARLPYSTREKPKHNRQLQRPKSESEIENFFLHFLQWLRKPRHPVGVWAKFAISKTWEQRKCQKPVH